MTKTAIILFNLGGPDSPEAVRPFLFNLFYDRAIIDLPNPFRWLIATVIASRRAPLARDIYGKIGGRSPLLPETEAQAAALQAAIGGDCRTFIAMRYWHPMTDATVAAVKAYAPDQVILLPLYPQYSKTTTGSSLALWKAEAKRQGLTAPTREIIDWPVLPGWIETVAAHIRSGLAELAGQKARVLLSAHGLPKKVIAGGDPYQKQVEQSAAAVVAALAQSDLDWPDLDWVVCYQSRVGPMEWIGPSTDDEIRRAGRDGVALVVAPIAFVSEHSETLVELDIEYRHLAEHSGVPRYVRVPTASVAPAFISALAGLVKPLMP